MIISLSVITENYMSQREQMSEKWLKVNSSSIYKKNDKFNP